ncbi:MAG: cofactor-independent phosphoglycerate mutase [Clostridia bacterium]|nr:cofactor-independent phosphoglycerate mutase [Clostridia bacterium]
MKYIVVLGDGMADYPVEKLGKMTPLEAAKKPNMDYMASRGELGMVKTVPDGIKPGSDVANLSVMGYDPQKYYTGRSPLEAASIGVPLKDEDVTFRCNLVTLSDEKEYENKTMIDYSSGEISTDEARKLIEAVNAELCTDVIKFYAGVSYRHLMVWENGSTDVNLTPPHDISDRKIGNYLPNGEGADKILEMMKKSEQILKEHPINKERIQAGKNPATSIWIWGEGKKPVLDSFYGKFGIRGSVISAVDLIKGIAKCAKMKSIDVEGATGNIDTNFDGKARAALSEITGDSDFLYIHVEAPDECGHRGEIENKIKAIELIDEKIIGFLRENLKNIDYKMLILPDHPTPLSLKTHVSDPVPYVIYDSRKESFSDRTYTEKQAKETGIYRDKGFELMGYFLDKV